jgi:hypothetical protein
VLTLYQQGVPQAVIASQLRLDVKTVRAIVRAGGVREPKARSDRTSIADALLTQLHHDCEGYVQRMHEILTEEHGIDIGYSTLTRLVRSKGLGVTHMPRACHVPDMPGEEMQHDTSEHQIRIGSTKQKMICSGLYLRYSKMRYVRFYRRFNRFTMKCFLDEALRHWGYSAHTCIIDNTCLAILYGSGPAAVFCPEMINFANNYGFVWKAHAIGHANRKAGKERNFYTVETNFFPGRKFASLEDLNNQAFNWATVRYAQRPQAKTKLIPVELFEIEKSTLTKLPSYISAPYLAHRRRIDEYGYVSFDGNYYWVPETMKDPWVSMLQYCNHLRIMDGIREVVRHDIAPDGVKNEKFTPPGHQTAPRGVPKNRKVGCVQEEARLREMGEPVIAYLDLAVSKDSPIRQRPAFIRGLYVLSKQWGPSLFKAALNRALSYEVWELSAVERIAQLIIHADTGAGHVDQKFPDYSQDYQRRPSYQEGQFTDEHDINYGDLS